jgi:fumarate reductase subunit C
VKKHTLDKTPARLDKLQSATGLILALFISTHLLFESSILFGKEAMYYVTKMFEGRFIFGQDYPIIIAIFALFILIVLIIHAALAMRKIPASYRQYKVFKAHMGRFKHEDTTLWLVQVITGFAMFFLASVHLFMMMLDPANIGPYVSAYRIVHEGMWMLYALLLVSVVLHAYIGLYRLAIKWGWFEGSNPKVSRKRLKFVMKALIAFYMILGFYSLSTYIYIGLNHDYNHMQKYEPTNEVTN